MKNHAVIVLRKGKEVLFVQRASTKKSLPNIWAFPSGTMEDGETPEMTAVREAREELRIDVEVVRSLGVVELTELDAKLFFIVCTYNAEQSIMYDLSEIQATRWFTFDEFFREYDDARIGHGLIYLRKHPELWN